MAYNYMPNYMPYQYQPQYQQPQQMATGFVSVRNIEEAFNYPIAPGNSITFKDENAPYVYTKTKGFSPLEQPVFERYRLVKEEPGETAKMPQNSPEAPQADKSIQEQIDSLKKRITALEERYEFTDDNASDAKPRKRPQTAKSAAEHDTTAGD